MKELSIFIDESGDFSTKASNDQAYLVTFVLHDQNIDISEDLKILESKVRNTGFDYLHCAPIIRREKPFDNLNIDERRKFIYIMLNFYTRLNIKHFTLEIKKNKIDSKVSLSGFITKELKKALDSISDYIDKFDKIIIYYDNGQVEISSVLNAVFTMFYGDKVEFRNASPTKYRLLQVADFICTFEYIKLKYKGDGISNSEEQFFYKKQELNKTFFKALEKKEIKIQWKSWIIIINCVESIEKYEHSLYNVKVR